MAYRAVFDEQRTFGVEIEVVGVPRTEIAYYLNEIGVRTRVTEYSKVTAPYWKVSTDSSIRGWDGAEVVSPILSGRKGLAWVDKVINGLSEIGCHINTSCGFHIHWNGQDYTGRNMLSLLRFYAKFERVIDFLVAPSRRGDSNDNCRSLVKDASLEWVTALDRSERARAAEVVMAFNQHHKVERYNPQTGQTQVKSSRYHKVNINAYMLYGTIEFRQHQGTLNPEKAINWAVFTQQLVNKAKEVSVSRQVSAKPTLGEMLRVLKIVDHEFIENRCTDPLILNLGPWLKKRYTQFRGGLIDE